MKMIGYKYIFTLSCVAVLGRVQQSNAQATNKIDTVGIVGIGTTNPGMLLDVHERLPANRVLHIRRGLQGYEPGLPATYGRPYIAVGGAEYKLNSIQAIGFGYSTDGSYQPAEIGFVTTNTGGYTSGDIVFATRIGGDNIAPSEAMRITNTGNVGIGTNVPSARMDLLEGNATKPVLSVKRGNQGQNAELSTAFGKPYVMIGGTEWKTGSMQTVGFGYTNNGSYQPAEIGFVTTNIGGYTSGDIVFATRAEGDNIVPSEAMRISNTGNLGIGTSSPTEKLSVNGNIKARKLIVTQANWPDYVFAEDYQPRSLAEVESYFKTNKRLPEMPSAKEVEEKGLSLGDTQALLLKKIEELTLCLVEMKKENKQQQQQIDTLTKQMKQRSTNQ